MRTVSAEPRALQAELSDRIRAIGQRFRRAALASSLSAEDMVLTHVIFATGAPIDVFVIDTGRLHAETLTTLARARGRYGIDIRVYQPSVAAVEAYVARHGRDGFYQSVELRHQCCHIRKVAPLEAALHGRDAWLTGQRRAQGPERAGLAVQERDEVRGIDKFNPLALWRDDDLWQFIEGHDVPFNPLHERGYPSIGCEPCTRAIKPGEPLRAGRWWWELAGEKKECGLHVPEATAARRSLDSRST